MRKMKFLGIIALAAVIGFSVTACDNNTTNGGSNGGGNGNGNGGNGNGAGNNNAFIGATLNLSGPVYVIEELDAAPWVRFTPHDNDDDHELVWTMWDYDNDELVTIGKGSVTGGNLSFTTITSPPAWTLEKWEIDDEWVDDQGQPIESIYPEDTKAVWLWSLDLAGGEGEILRGNLTINQAGTTRTETEEWVAFIYVDQDATWTSRKFTDIYEDTETWTREAFTINLRAGWNAIHEKEVDTETATSHNETTIISAGNPADLKWILLLDRTDHPSCCCD